MKPSNRVALILSDINSYRLIPGIHKVASQGRDYWMVDVSRPINEIKSLISQWKPQGLIIEWLPFVTEHLIDLGIPTIVTIGEADDFPVPSVDVDDARVGKLAAAHLIGLTLKQFAFLGESTPYSRQREAAFRSYIEDHGFECHSFFRSSKIRLKYIEHWHESETGLLRWIRSLPKPIGIFAAHDPSGRLLAEACRAESIRIPEEVAIVGANNDHHVCGMTYPPLSSIDIPWETIGYETAMLMERYLSDPSSVPHQPVLIPPTKVIPRRSSDFLSVSNPTLANALAYIHEYACNGIRVMDVVGETHTSRRNLERDFKKVLGKTIHEEIIRARIDRSKELLKRADLSIDQIAEISGFGRNERFTVNFRKWEGVTPRDYRKSLAKKIVLE